MRELREITFSSFDADRRRVHCEANQRVRFDVAENLAQAGGVTVTVTSSAAEVEEPTSESLSSSEGAVSAPVVRAMARGYTFDVPENYPAAFALWRRQVRGMPLDDRDWARTLNGTASPVRQVSIGGVDYLLGWVCEPHNCGGNEALVVIRPEQDRVFGLIRLTGSNREVTDRVVGAASATEERCLAFFLEDRSEAARCP